MLFVLFSLLYFIINYSSASTHSGGENESLSFPFNVPPKILADYELEKNKIISFLSSEFGNKNEFHITLKNSAKFKLLMQNICKINAKELLKAMMQDNIYEYFLPFFWSSNRPRVFGLSFLKANTLYSLKLPLTFLSYEDVKRIFKNFRRFIFKASVNTSPQEDSDGKELLSISQMFWHQKFVPLGIKVMDEDELELEHKLIEKRFRFLERFLNIDPKVQIIWEYKRLQRAIQNDLKSTFANKCFSFLSQHLNYRLRTLPDSEFLDDLAWLASQSKLFLTYFFYVLYYQQYKEAPPLWHLIHQKAGWIDLVGKFQIRSFIILEEKDLIIFSKRTYESVDEQAEAVKLARMILKKLGTKIALHNIRLKSFI